MQLSNDQRVGIVLVTILLVVSFQLCKSHSISNVSALTPIVLPNRANDIQILQTSVKEDDGVYYIYCRVRNKSSSIIQLANFTGTFYDRNKTVIGTGIGTAMNIAANATITVTLIATNISNPASYDVQIDCSM